ncbi:MAG: glycosyltransferase family 4 protein [Acidiferrobacteraceae bacterium]
MPPTLVSQGDLATDRLGEPRRLAIIASHPIQYQAPLFQALAKRPNLDLTVFFCSDHGATERPDPGFGQIFKWDRPLLEGYRYEFLRNRSPRPAVTGFFGELNPALVWRLARGRFDAVLVHGYSYASCWLAFLGTKLGRARLLMRAESHLLEPRPPWKRALKAAILRPTFKLLDAGLAIGSLNYAYYRHYGVPPLKLIYAPYSVDNDFFAAEAGRWRPERVAIRRELGLPEQAPVALFCAKLLWKKRPLDLLQALVQTRSEPRVHALIVGDGPLRSDCEAFARAKLPGRVAFAGFQNQTALPRMYAASDHLVLPSDVEPWGLVVNEAMAAGLPVLASSSVGAAADLIRPDTESGLIFPAGDVAALTRALDAVCVSDRLATLSRGAQAAIRNWSLKETVEGVLTAVYA